MNYMNICAAQFPRSKTRTQSEHIGNGNGTSSLWTEVELTTSDPPTCPPNVRHKHANIKFSLGENHQSWKFHQVQREKSKPGSPASHFNIHGTLNGSSGKELFGSRWSHFGRRSGPGSSGVVLLYGWVEITWSRENSGRKPSTTSSSNGCKPCSTTSRKFSPIQRRTGSMSSVRALQETNLKSRSSDLFLNSARRAAFW